MRFHGLSLHHNPHQLTIENDGNVRAIISPCCQPDSVHLGLDLRRISGEGELYGVDCIAQFEELQCLQRSGECGKLVLPHMEPLYAYLKELRLTAGAEEDVLRFRFVFVETRSPVTYSRGSAVYITGAEGESLWDIAYFSHTTIDELVRLNPQIAYIDHLKAGERVQLC